MGSAQSVPKAPPVDHVPKPSELKKYFEPVEKFPPFMTDKNDLTSKDKQIQVILRKTNKNKRGDSYRIKEAEQNSLGGNDDWLGEHGIFVEPVFKFGLVRRSLEDLTGVFRGKEAEPLAYWMCDVSRGVNKFKIFKETPTYKTQKPMELEVQEVDEGGAGLGTLLASPFKGKKKVDVYTYASVDFDMKTTIVSILVFGAPKCHGEGNTPYRMRQANGTTWILYKYLYSTQKYKECALFVQKKSTPIVTFPSYETTISPGIDPVLVICIQTILDNFWEHRLKKARIKFY